MIADGFGTLTGIDTALTGVGIVGLGRWGKNHLRVFSELGLAKATCDVDARIERLPDSSAIPHFNDINAFLDSGLFQAVVIATPDDTHFELAKLALEAGKHVLVEKPFCSNYAHAITLSTIAKANNRVFMVGHLLHFHPAIIKLKALVKEGLIGELRYATINRLNLSEFRQTSDVLWDLAPHDFSLLLSLVNDLPSHVNCHGTDYLTQGVVGISLSTLRFLNGFKAHCVHSWLNPVKEQTFTLVGTQGMLVFDDTKQAYNEKLKFYTHVTDWKNAVELKPLVGQCHNVNISESEPLKAQAKHFVDCVTHNTQPITSIDEGMRVLKVLLACQRSLGGAGGVVSLTESYEQHTTEFVDVG